MTDNLIANGQLVEALGSCLRKGDHALNNVPDLLAQVIKDRAWEQFSPTGGGVRKPRSFTEFITKNPLTGLGSSIDMIRRICRDREDVLVLLEQQLQEDSAHGGDRRSTDFKVSNLNLETSQKGETRAQAFKALSKRRPDLLGKVADGELSPHAAMLEAGLRHRRVSIRADDPVSAAQTLRAQLPPSVLAELIKLLKGNDVDR